MEKINVVIVEDELLIAQMLKELLEELEYNVLNVFTRYSQAVEYFENLSEYVDLVFLDINLNDVNTGIDLGKYLYSNLKIPFVYLTSYSDVQTIKKASGTYPESYLVKPVNINKLLPVLEIVKAKINRFFYIKEGYKKIKINKKTIQWIRSEKNYITIQCEDKKIVLRKSLNNFLEEINDESIRQVHRSYAINLYFVSEVLSQSIKIGEKEIPVSRKFKDVLTSLS